MCLELNFYLEISNSVSPVSLLPHVPVHVLKPVDPALELDEVRSMGLDCEMDRRLSLGHIVMSSSSGSWLTSLITMGNLYFASAGISQRTRAQNRE